MHFSLSLTKMQHVEIDSFQAFRKPDKELEYPAYHSTLDLSPLCVHLSADLGKI